MKKLLLVLFMVSTMISADNNPDEIRKRAERLAKEIIIIDTHIDLPGRLQYKWEDVSQSTGGDFDYPRAKSGGLDVAFMSVYVAARFENNGAKIEADSVIDIVEKIVNDYPDKFARADSPSDVYQNFKNGKISLPMGMENGSPIEGDLKNLKYFYDRGIRYITLAHSKSNHICDSSYDPERKWKGLSPFGKEVVKEMNRLGIMIDVSHITDDAFYQVMEESKAPVIASHSSCRFFTPDFERNMDDNMIKALAKNGGVIQIAFVSNFLSKEIRDKEAKNRAAIAEHLRANNIPSNDKRASEFAAKYWNENPVGYADVKDVVRHISHVVKLVGIDHVGLGSDFDGAGDSFPYGLKDVSYFPNLIYELLLAGYSKKDIQKICGGNLLRVWKQVEKISETGK
ncbi:MAG: dipeptidase [Bacteroidota bacterium]